MQLVEGPDDRLCAVLFDGATSTITCYRHVGDDRAPVAVASALPVAGPLPLVVDFSSEGSSDEDGDPLTFRWDFGDGASADGPSARHAYTTAGARTARLTVSDGRGLQAFDEIAILAGDALPEPVIDRPEAGATWAVGDAIALSGRAHDPEDGALSGESLRWQVRVQHAQHVHFDAFAATGGSAVMTAPDHGDDASLLACLTATDSAGARRWRTSCCCAARCWGSSPRRRATWRAATCTRDRSRAPGRRRPGARPATSRSRWATSWSCGA